MNSEIPGSTSWDHWSWAHGNTAWASEQRGKGESESETDLIRRLGSTPQQRIRKDMKRTNERTDGRAGDSIRAGIPYRREKRSIRGRADPDGQAGRSKGGGAEWRWGGMCCDPNSVGACFGAPLRSVSGLRLGSRRVGRGMEGGEREARRCHTSIRYRHGASVYAPTRFDATRPLLEKGFGTIPPVKRFIINCSEVLLATLIEVLRRIS